MSTVRIYICPHRECKRTYYDYNRYKCHVYRHVQEEWYCRDCHKTFIRPSIARKHAAIYGHAVSDAAQHDQHSATGHSPPSPSQFSKQNAQHAPHTLHTHTHTNTASNEPTPTGANTQPPIIIATVIESEPSTSDTTYAAAAVHSVTMATLSKTRTTCHDVAGERFIYYIHVCV